MLLHKVGVLPVTWDPGLIVSTFCQNRHNNFYFQFFYYIVFEQVHQMQASSRTDHFPKENEQIQLEGTKLSHKFSFHLL